MSNFKNLEAAECADALFKIKNPLILIHVRPDGDCIGSAAALSLIFSELGKKAEIASSDKIPDRLKFILEKTGACITENYNGKTAISVDVASPAQLGDLAEIAPAPVLMIDHHAVGVRYADGYVKPDSSSTGEVLYDIAEELIKQGKIKMTKPLAYALYTAISSDTGCFCYSNATPDTYRKAARLMESGIDYPDINHRLFNSKSERQIKAEGFIASILKTAKDGKIAYAALKNSDKESLALCDDDFETAIDVVRSVLGAKTALFVRETDNGKIKASLRSTDNDVAGVAAKFGGGGHVRAAGCSPNAKCAEEATKMILDELYKLYE